MTIQAKATMKEAWAERHRLRMARDYLWEENDCPGAESDRLGAEGDLVVILTAQKEFGLDAEIDWAKGTVTKGKKQQVLEQEVIAYFWGSLIHPDVEIRRIDNQTIVLLNRITGATLTLTAEAVKLEHVCERVGGFTCHACEWEYFGPPPVKLSILKGQR